MKKWNPRYVAYARSNGMTPEAMLKHDKAKGIFMIEFSIWIQRKWTEYVRAKGFKFSHWKYVKSEEDHAAFDVFIGCV